MTRRTDKPAPSSNGAAEKELGDLVVRLGERERLLRALLLDSRDALIRTRLEKGKPAASDPGTRLPRASAPAQAGSAARVEDPGYAALRRRFVTAVSALVPRGAKILVASRGDERLLDLEGGGVAEHFPADARGRYAGHHPADSRAAIAELEARRASGAGWFVLPATSRWWLDHYTELARYLDGRFERVIDSPETGVAFDLGRSARAESTTSKPRSSAVPSERAAAPAPAAVPRRIAAATIISRNYLAQARVLAASFLEHEPGGRFYLLVVDHLPDGVEVGLDVTLVDPRELAIPSFYEMCFKYGVIELSTAVKPYLLSLLMGQYGEEDVVYLDPDIWIQRPMLELRGALDGGSAVLTPHITRPLPVDGKHPTEQDIMISGAYNLGFIALRRSPEARELLSWWEEKLRDGCRIDVSNGLFTDQKWIDLVPSLFPFTIVLRDPTYNVAFWNLHEREIARAADGFLVNGLPATFFHISGFNPREPGKLSKHQSRIEVEPGSALAKLLESYAALLFAAGYEEASGWEYGYERFANGVRVHPLLRQLYLNLSVEERLRFGDPFAVGGRSFLEWATGPNDKPGELSRFLSAVYQTRYDLPLAFPDVRGRDRAAFLNWARRWGANEMRFETDLVRDEGSGRRPAHSGANGKPAPGKAPAPSGNAAWVAKPATDPSPANLAPGSPAHPANGATNAGMATADYPALVDRIRDLARAALPAGSRVLVVNKGDYRLLDLGGLEGWHFPQTESGVYGGFYPADGRTAVAHLEALREKGADFLVLPRTAAWWLEHYPEFREHLESRCRKVVHDEQACTIYALRGGGAQLDARRADERASAPPPRTAEAASEPARSPAPVRTSAPAVPAPPVVIYGAARSGTTYLVNILNQHPKIYISDESRVFLWAKELVDRLRGEERARSGDREAPGGRRVGDRAALRDYLLTALPGLLRDYYRELAPRAEVWGDKNPHYADPRDFGCLETIVRLYPGARFLHLIRDGRDVVTSGMRGTWTDFDAVHRMWTSHLDLGRTFGRTLPSGQYLEFHYEELVRDDAAVAGRILDFLGVERHPKVEKFCQEQQRRRTRFCTPSRDLVDDPLRSDWSSFFSPDEQLRSLEMLGEHLVRFGYESPRSIAEARGRLEVGVTDEAGGPPH